MIYYFYRVNNEDIYLIKFILESFENIMTVSTVDEALPKIQITIAPDFLKDAEDILGDMAKRFPMQKIPDPSNFSQGNY